MLRVYGVLEKLLKAVKSFHVDSKLVREGRVGMDNSELFPVNVEILQGCMMSPWLFNVCKVGVVRDVYAWVLGKGLELLLVNGVRFEKNQLLFEDDAAPVADSGEIV